MLETDYNNYFSMKTNGGRSPQNGTCTSSGTHLMPDTVSNEIREKVLLKGPSLVQKEAISEGVECKNKLCMGMLTIETKMFKYCSLF